MDRQAKIDRLKSQAESVRIGGKGSARRKKKIVHKNTGTDERKVTTTLKKLGVSAIPGIEEVNMFWDNGEIIHFNNPKVQASLQANTFAITGQSETKSITEMLPNVWNQMGPENFASLKKMATSFSPGAKAGESGADSKTEADATASHKDDDEVPELTENFDEQSKTE